MRHWLWRLTHPSQWMAARRYDRATQAPPRERWNEALKIPPTARYCRVHRTVEALDSACFNEATPMSPERRGRLVAYRPDGEVQQ